LEEIFVCLGQFPAKFRFSKYRSTPGLSQAGASTDRCLDGELLFVIEIALDVSGKSAVEV